MKKENNQILPKEYRIDESDPDMPKLIGPLEKVIAYYTPHALITEIINDAVIDLDNRNKMGTNKSE